MRTQFSKIARVAGTSLALALTFSCSSDDNQGNNGGSGTNNLCNGVSYDQSLYRCELGELIGKCRGLDYYVAYERCVDGVVVDNNSNKSSSSSYASVTPSSSSAVSSSGSKPSSSSVTYTLTCADLPTIAAVGTVINRPRVTCNGSVLSQNDLTWTGTPNVPDWSNLGTGTYNNISVLANHGNCNGQTAICGTLTIQSEIIYGDPVTYQGETYKTVEIGTQVWMSKNLNYNASDSKCYNNSESNCAIYGRLYTWITAMAGSASSDKNPSGIRGICPLGWHIPSDGEWETLTSFVGSPSGTKLKANSNLWSTNTGTDTFGFAALPGGGGGIGGGFGFDVGDFGCWWTTGNGGGGLNGSYKGTNIEADYFGSYAGSRNGTLCSVRCLKD